jgi:hypothetical protein
MKGNQALWFLLAAVALYYGSVYCGELLKALYPVFDAWFGGRPLPAFAEYALGVSGFVARLGPWIAAALLVLAAVSFWFNRKASAVDERVVAVINAVGYYAARGVLIGLVVLAILQAHGMLIIFLNVDREIRKELGKPVPEIESKGR